MKLRELYQRQAPAARRRRTLLLQQCDRKDLDDRTKVTLYNQVLQRYKVLSDKHVKEPVRVVTVNKPMPAVSGKGAGARAGAGRGAFSRVNGRSP